MANVTVNIVGGTQQENTREVEIGNVWWGYNHPDFGERQIVPNGGYELTVHKTTPPEEISTEVQIHEDVDINIEVNDADVSVVNL